MAAGTYTSRVTAKFWVMPRTGPATLPVDSAATGATATKGFDLARDLIGGLPELEDQIGGAMVGTSGQKRSERVATAVRDLQSFDVSFRDNRAPHAASPAMVGAGTVFKRTIIDARPENAAPWRCELEYANGDSVAFNVQFGNRKTIPAVGLEGDDAITGLSLTFMPTGVVTYT